MIRQPDQIIQRQPLGEFAELITLFRADQRIKIAPVFHLLRGLRHFRHQRPLVLPIICILFNLLADFPLACRVFTQLLRQLRQPLRELLRRTRWLQTGGRLLLMVSQRLRGLRA
ncbi:Uncharacterised protein [Salmonella enterica subsp. arizonae]|uniref:Uncharacterized protein n=1 Tax=Salmonella enterica subsp. arizonae TaxID=59203 RepID=A0A447R8I9_SALER|nr:Uncharacterised protein [Salmonella enterica subsp. arizonae]